MNLINDTWIPVVREDGTHCRIAPWQVAETDNPVVEVAAPRPDFQGGLYQFLIGLLQTCLPPTDADEWEERFEDIPSVETLKAAFSKVSAAFELTSDVGKPAFLQDLDMSDGEDKDIATLLIEAPGAKTEKDHLDFFIKGGLVNGMCSCCATQALFTLQTNAPSGGAGHRVGLRGGGPLTTLVMPVGEVTLWNKLWLNVLADGSRLSDSDHIGIEHIFPWLAATRVSDKTGAPVTPETTNPLQMYWGMPRRIRLVASGEEGRCDLCGDESELFKQFKMKNYGVNYDGPWVHPLTPYRFDIKKTDSLPLSLKGQKGGLSYRNWLGLVFTDADNGDSAASVVRDFYEEKCLREPLHLWCFGFDMDNMKARCWYDHTLPLFNMSSKNTRKVQGWIQHLLTAAKDTTPLLRKQIKAAWYRSPENAGGDISFIDTEFWQSTEPEFYSIVGKMAAASDDCDLAPSELYMRWYRVLAKTVENLFDQYALKTSVEDLDLQRVIIARSQLMSSFYKKKSIQLIKEKGQATKEATSE